MTRPAGRQLGVAGVVDPGQNDDPGSVLAFYRHALAARQQIDPAAAIEWLEIDRDDALGFRRGALVCVAVFDGSPVEPPAEWGAPIITSSTEGGAVATWFVAE
jgi:hypothetical protein